MNKIKNTLIVIFVAVMLTAGTVSDAGPTGPEVCYAERGCDKGSVSCQIAGPDCDAKVTTIGVVCDGFDSLGARVHVELLCDK